MSADLKRELRAMVIGGLLLGVALWIQDGDTFATRMTGLLIAVQVGRYVMPARKHPE